MTKRNNPELILHTVVFPF